MNSLGLLITLIPVVALMALVVVLREKRYLEARLPSEYSSCRAAVRYPKIIMESEIGRTAPRSLARFGHRDPGGIAPAIELGAAGS